MCEQRGKADEGADNTGSYNNTTHVQLLVHCLILIRTYLKIVMRYIKAVLCM